MMQLLMAKTLMLSNKTLDYLWKPPQGTFLYLMAFVSHTFA